ncbi:hypothetical protein [Desulfovibrio piger]|uniref:hypothetical protein n=1 Tax=Desulfovibrio piger TaxID=901 RepID=UPI0024308657|nr:hypothetical protein [Desulfovibrio piger]MCI6940911.1 hypothetical protein [Desulfovibrio piger]MCI7506495.1 hypothetical protein [Desulfovibrio piger]
MPMVIQTKVAAGAFLSEHAVAGRRPYGRLLMLSPGLARGSTSAPDHPHFLFDLPHWLAEQDALSEIMPATRLMGL